MTLASMIAIDEDALICDLAEVYHIYDYRSLPVHLVATFSAGLRENSRIQRKMRGDKLTYTDAILAQIYDRIGTLFWMLYSDGDYTPPSLFDMLNGDVRPEKEAFGFDTPEEFEEARMRIIKGGS